MSALARILALVLIVGLGFVAYRHFTDSATTLIQARAKAPMPRLEVAEGPQSAFALSRRQMEMTLAAAKITETPKTDKAEPALLSKSLQLVLVTASDWDDSTGQMQRYRRPLASMPWEKVGGPAPCVLGKDGLAPAGPGAWSTKCPAEKKDGDGRTPAGVFLASQGFGFRTTAEAKDMGLKLPYVEAGDQLTCVSDPKSPQLNKLAPSAGKRGPKSVTLGKAGELNRWGLLLDAYEQGQPAPSCLVLRLWAEPGKPTAGEIGCHEARMLELLAWLDPSTNPAVAVVPISEMDGLKAAWGLP